MVVPHAHGVHVRTTKGIDKAYEVLVDKVIEEINEVFVVYAINVVMVQMVVRNVPTILHIAKNSICYLDHYEAQIRELKMLSKRE